MDWPAWHREALKDLGIREVPGPANNKRILKLFGDGGFGYPRRAAVLFDLGRAT